MADIEELKQLVAQQTRDLQAQNLASQKRVDDLIQALADARMAPVHVPEVEPGVAVAAAVIAHAEKISKLGIALRKSYKVKEFKDNHEGSVKEWLTRWDQEINTLKKMCNIADDLTRGETVELFKDKLEYAVVKRLDTAFAAKDPQWTWNDLTYDNLKAIHYG